MDACALTCEGCGGPAAAVECMDARGLVPSLRCRSCRIVLYVRMPCFEFVEQLLDVAARYRTQLGFA